VKERHGLASVAPLHAGVCLERGGEGPSEHLGGEVSPLSWPAALTSSSPTSAASGTLSTSAPVPAGLPQQGGILQGVGGFDPVLDRMFVQMSGAAVLGIDAGTGAFASTTTIVTGTYNGISNPELVP